MARPLSTWAAQGTQETNSLVQQALAEVADSLRQCPMEQREMAVTPMKLLITAGLVFDDPRSARMAARHVATSGLAWYAHPEFERAEQKYLWAALRKKEEKEETHSS